MLSPEQIQQLRQKVGVPEQGTRSMPSPAARIGALRNQTMVAASEQTTAESPVSLKQVGKEGTGKTLGQFLISEPQQDEKLGSRLVRGLLGNVKGFGESAAGAIMPFTESAKKTEEVRQRDAEIVAELSKRIKQGRDAGEDVSHLTQALIAIGGGTMPSDKELNSALNKSTKQVVGESVGLAADIIGAGKLPDIKKTITLPTTFFSGALKGLAVGGGTGLLFGATQGGARAAQQDKTAGQIAAEAGVGGAVGGVTGGLLGSVLGGVSGWLGGRQIKAQQAEQIKQALNSGNLTDADTAQYMLPSVERIDNMQTALKKDPTAQEAIRQGLADRDVALIKVIAQNPDDLTTAQKMVNLIERANKDRTITERPMDLAGDIAIQPMKHLKETIAESGRQLDDVAESLVGQPVDDIDDLISTIDDDLARRGVSITDTFEEAGEVALKRTQQKLNFEGSDFEGLGANEKIVNNIYNRLTTAKDAHDLHRLKKYIDSNVEYGKGSGDLSGVAERMVKAWRRMIDETLDRQFGDYNKVNSELSEMLGAIEQVQGVMGRKFNINDPLANIQAGQVSSRLLGNSPLRGKVLQALLDVDRVAQKYGFQSKNNIIYQVNMADILDDLYKTQATRGFQGGITRGVEQAGGAIQDVAQGQPISALAKTGVRIYENLRGINPEALRSSLKTLLKMTGQQGAAATKSSKFSSLPNKQGGFVRNPFMSKATFKSIPDDDLGEVLDFIDNVRLKGAEDVANEIAARRLAERYGVNPDQSNGKLANAFARLIEKTPEVRKKATRKG